LIPFWGTITLSLVLSHQGRENVLSLLPSVGEVAERSEVDEGDLERFTPIFFSSPIKGEEVNTFLSEDILLPTELAREVTLTLSLALSRQGREDLLSLPRSGR
jgi:hypothetical protein